VVGLHGARGARQRPRRRTYVGASRERCVGSWRQVLGHGIAREHRSSVLWHATVAQRRTVTRGDGSVRNRWPAARGWRGVARGDLSGAPWRGQNFTGGRFDAGAGENWGNAPPTPTRPDNGHGVEQFWVTGRVNGSVDRIKKRISENRNLISIQHITEINFNRES
jgi:hypothetical protein